MPPTSQTVVDLDPNELQRSIAATVDDFCADRCSEDVVRRAVEAFPFDLWRDLAALGVFDLATLGDEAGVAAICIACESLGRASFPGPVAATYMAADLLDDDQRKAVTSGQSLVAVSDGGLTPWAPLAKVFVLYAGGSFWNCSPDGDIEAVTTLGGEPWGRVDLTHNDMLGAGGRALAIFNIAHAAYYAAAARRLVTVAAEHAATRRQFGKALGNFQAIAHPLADCAMQLDASAALARAAACGVDDDNASATLAAAAARRSADAAARRTVVVCHQVFGAIGITVEGPAFHISRRLQQAAAVPPTPRIFDARLVESIAQAGISHDS